MSNKRIFNDDQLREMGRRSLDCVLEQIDAGNAEEAKRLAQRMYNEFVAMHDLYRDWITGTLSSVGKRYGDVALEEVMSEGLDSWWTPMAEKINAVPDDFTRKVKMFVAGLRGHLQPMDIREDDEKIEIRMMPCGSGGRQIQAGKYEGPKAFLKVATPQRMTYGRPDMPVYCTHEIAMERLDAIRDGHPFVITEPAAELGRDYCVLKIYKDPKDIPAHYYERLGLTKPAGEA